MPSESNQGFPTHEITRWGESMWTTGAAWAVERNSVCKAASDSNRWCYTVLTERTVLLFQRPGVPGICCSRDLLFQERCCKIVLLETVNTSVIVLHHLRLCVIEADTCTGYGVYYCQGVVVLCTPGTELQGAVWCDCCCFTWRSL